MLEDIALLTGGRVITEDLGIKLENVQWQNFGEAKAQTGSVGYNAANGEMEDLIAAGVIDPAKVTTTALQNAASIAGLMLTTEALVSEIKEEKPDAPPAPDMGGMGGMM